ncbi:MAG: hypothetical protein ACD_3C00042G0003 [uncultured bacterium (gcode 4)]|uniref:Uncharacterized protein n=1 Tax=uncultured bacterium (gcode 4) TaxID=1234023 RepID=K2G069_9BACT|nr:MAG: hypothetical protein ACD_3C00042G0003 [uncultured bacterium (gcode 4)]
MSWMLSYEILKIISFRIYAAKIDWFNKIPDEQRNLLIRFILNIGIATSKKETPFNVRCVWK